MVEDYEEVFEVFKKKNNYRKAKACGNCIYCTYYNKATTICNNSEGVWSEFSVGNYFVCNLWEGV